MIAQLAGAAFAGQVAFDVERAPDRMAFRYRWTDGLNREHAVSFELPSAAVLADEAAAERRVQAEMPAEVAGLVRERTAGRVEGVEITATEHAGAVRLGVSGSGDVHAGIALAHEVYAEVMREWLDEHRHARFGPTELGWDLSRLAAEYADDVAPLATALAAEASTDRQFADRAISFVQSIPYESPDGDGYRPPLALLSVNRGDCDSKAVLFLALVRAHSPEVPLAVVRFPGHVVVALGLARTKGDRSFVADRVRYVYAEPVGPALRPVGEIAPENVERAADGVVLVVP